MTPSQIRTALRLAVLALISLAIVDDSSAQFADVSYGSTGSTLRGHAFGDIDGDGDLDAMVVGSDRVLSWYSNDGAGGFGPSQVVAGDNTPTKNGPVVLHDLDGDGDQDVLAPQRVFRLGATYCEVARYLNGGTGTFTQVGPVMVELCVQGGALVRLKVVDLNSDGAEELLAWDSMTETVVATTSLASAASELLIFPRLTAPSVVSTVDDLQVGDLDGDGDRDVVLGRDSNGAIVWHENPGTPIGSGLWPVARSLSPTPFPLVSSTLADVDQDGDVDVLTVDSVSGVSNVRMYVNPGNGMFASPLLLAQVPGDLVDLECVDIDQDGNQDIVAVTGSGLCWWKGTGTLAFGSFGQRLAIGQPVQGLRSVGVLDGDQDGDFEVTASSEFFGFPGAGELVAAQNVSLDPIGTNYCGPAVVNSTGASGSIQATGSLRVAVNQVRLSVGGLPGRAFGIFIASQTTDFVPMVGSSIGALCLGQPFQRLPGVFLTGPDGIHGRQIDLATVLGAPITAGATWHFQAWHRDVPSSANLTDALTLDFE